VQSGRRTVVTLKVFLITISKEDQTSFFMKCEEEHVDHFLNSDRAVNLPPQVKLVISRITGCATGKHPEKTRKQTTHITQCPDSHCQEPTILTENMLPVTVLLTKLETERDVLNDDLKRWQNLLQVLQKKSSRCEFNDDRIAPRGELRKWT
jgi:hypothetical protein